MHQSTFLREVAFVFLLSLLLVSPVSAQSADNGLRLITSPLPINLTVDPGNSISTQIKIKNDGSQEEHLKVSTLKFKAYQDGGQPQLLDPDPNDESVRWISFSEPSFTIAPQEWKTITVTLDVPASAAFGYYYALEFSRMNDEAVLEKQQAVLQGGTAVLLLLDVNSPNAKREVQVAGFSTDRSFYEFLPTTFSVTLKNTGNVHLIPKGDIFIEKGDQKNIAILPINATQGNILPDSSRAFSAQWKDGFPLYTEKQENGNVVLDEFGKPIKKLTWDFSQASKLRFGKYTAKMVLVYDDGHRDIPIEGEVSFWVIPWRVAGGAFLVIFFMLIGVRSSIGKIWRKLFSRKSSENPV